MKTNENPKLPAGRPRINLNTLLKVRTHAQQGLNPCALASLEEPLDEYRLSLVKGLRKILPFMYRTNEQVIEILQRYGMDFSSNIPVPTSKSFQWAHAGELLMCAYFEECENKVVLTYKWRLSTTKNQHQFGMDLIAFDLNTSPPEIYLIAVKTTKRGETGKAPSVVSDALSELKTYLRDDRIDNDLEIICANLHTTDSYRIAFETWYDPYTQSHPSYKPKLIPVPAFIVEATHWQDKYAASAISSDFGIPGIVRVLCIDDLNSVVENTYSL